MTPFVAYDVSRLLARYAVPTPNGIDRIDLAYARHFLADSHFPGTGVFLNGLQPWLLDRDAVRALLDDMAARWETGGGDASHLYAHVRDRLLGKDSAKPAAAPPRHRLNPLRVLGARGLRGVLLDRIPDGAVFLHATHYPSSHLFSWLGRRRDVKAVFFIHDLLPLQFPEYFAPRHVGEHRRALEIFARHGNAAIVNTHVVAEQVSRFLQDRGRSDVPALVTPIPPGAQFSASVQADPALADMAYFVTCGTIEPRKNHLMLLHAWRDLARQWGEKTPKLIVIGRRGWENENVVDLLDRSSELRGHVIEAAGLPTSDVARLLSGARALLMPSFAEGYGLPIVEARVAGTPVIASDIPVFREIAPDATFRQPLDGLGWLDAIKDHATNSRRCSSSVPQSHADYFASVEDFIRVL